jgi:hypothetical protein
MHNIDEFDSAMDRLIRRVRDSLGDSVNEGAEAVGDEFRRTARRLSGAHADSFTVAPRRSSGDRVSAQFGPTEIYSRKISLRFGDLDAAIRSAGPRALQNAMVNSYERVVR